MVNLEKFEIYRIKDMYDNGRLKIDNMSDISYLYCRNVIGSILNNYTQVIPLLIEDKFGNFRVVSGCDYLACILKFINDEISYVEDRNFISYKNLNALQRNKIEDFKIMCNIVLHTDYNYISKYILIGE